MKPAIMARSLRPPLTGVGRYTLNLLHSVAEEMAPEPMVVFSIRGTGQLNGFNGERVVAPFRTPREFQRLLWEQTFVPAEVRRRGIDIYHSPNHVLPLALPCRSVVTFHDLAFQDHRFLDWRNHFYLNVLAPLAVLRASRIIAISQYTRAQIVRRFPGAAGKVSVVYQGVDPMFSTPPRGDEVEAFRKRQGLGRYVLSVGVIQPRKNLRRLFRAFESL